MRTSIFDLFRVGIGPSSSHTAGPMRAARDFAGTLERHGQLGAVRGLEVDLYGSLALTGRGHQTGIAIPLGLSGEDPQTVDPARIEPLIAGIRKRRVITLPAQHEIPFDEREHLRLHARESLPGHPNALRLTAVGDGGAVLRSQVYYSVGGGSIVREGEPGSSADSLPDVGDDPRQ